MGGFSKEFMAMGVIIHCLAGGAIGTTRCEWNYINHIGYGYSGRSNDITGCLEATHSVSGGTTGTCKIQWGFLHCFIVQVHYTLYQSWETVYHPGNREFQSVTFVYDRMPSSDTMSPNSCSTHSPRASATGFIGVSHHAAYSRHSFNQITSS